MDKVYVVTSGSYSEYGIRGVFSSRKLAKVAISTAQGLKDEDGDSLVYWASDTYIEEWALNDLLQYRVQKEWTCGLLLDDGSIVEPKRHHSRLIWESPFRGEVVQCGVKVPFYNNRPIVRTRSTVSQKHAEKLAVEARQKWLRESK
jgi:hypothetical protein